MSNEMAVSGPPVDGDGGVAVSQGDARAHGGERLADALHGAAREGRVADEGEGVRVGREQAGEHSHGAAGVAAVQIFLRVVPLPGGAGDFDERGGVGDGGAEGLDAGEGGGAVGAGGEVGEAGGAAGEAGEQGVAVRDGLVARGDGGCRRGCVRGGWSVWRCARGNWTCLNNSSGSASQRASESAGFTGSYCVLRGGATDTVESGEVGLHPAQGGQGVEHGAEHGCGGWIGGRDEAVVHPFALAARGDDAGAAEIAEMAGDLGLVLAQESVRWQTQTSRSRRRWSRRRRVGRPARRGVREGRRMGSGSPWSNHIWVDACVKRWIYSR